jgi:hypothetical protein
MMKTDLVFIRSDEKHIVPFSIDKDGEIDESACPKHDFSTPTSLCCTT